MNYALKELVELLEGELSFLEESLKTCQTRLYSSTRETYLIGKIEVIKRTLIELKFILEMGD